MKQTEWVMIPLNKVRRFALWREAEKHEFLYSWGNIAGTIINVLLNSDEIGTDEAEFLYEFIRLKAERAQRKQGKYTEFTKSGKETGTDEPDRLGRAGCNEADTRSTDL